MKNRKKAEARANELFPKVAIYSQHYVTNQIGRKAFLQCYDEMQQQNKELRAAAEYVIEKRKQMHSLTRKEPFSHAELKVAVSRLDEGYKHLKIALNK